MHILDKMFGLEGLVLLAFGLIMLLLIAKDIKYFVLAYILARPVLACFWGVGILGSFNILEISASLFPLLLIGYHARRSFQNVVGPMGVLYTGLVMWVLASNCLKQYSGYDASDVVNSYSYFVRILNGYAAFVVFPLVFDNRRDRERLMTVFLLATVFPLLQGLVQIVLGPSAFGMATSQLARGEMGDYTMYYGFYYKYEGYAWASLLGTMLVGYKIASDQGSRDLRVCLFASLGVLYLLLASMTLSRLLVVELAITYAIGVPAVIARARQYGGGLGRLGFVLATVLCIGMFFLRGFLGERLEQLMTRSDKEVQVLAGEEDVQHGFHGRVGLWESQLARFNECSLIERVTGTNIAGGPHSDYVNWLAQYGYVGLGLYLMTVLGLTFGSINRLMSVRRCGDLAARAYAYTVVTALCVWLAAGIIHTPSRYPDQSCFTMGIAGILFANRCWRSTCPRLYQKSAPVLDG
jgi:hypothetical protein